MAPEDVLAGFERRIVRLKASLSLCCDTCAKPINPGDEIIATTYWNKNREGAPWDWEAGYGKK